MADREQLARALLGLAAENYNTPLSQQEEAAFLRWQAALPKQLQSTQDYDLRGAWKANAKEAANGHLPDTWKKPNHPTFSNGSIYSGPYAQGGNWVEPTDPRMAERGEGYTYFATPDNLRYRDAAALQAYFRAVEPTSRVILPQNDAPILNRK